MQSQVGKAVALSSYEPEPAARRSTCQPRGPSNLLNTGGPHRFIEGCELVQSKNCSLFWDYMSNVTADPMTGVSALKLHSTVVGRTQ